MQINKQLSSIGCSYEQLVDINKQLNNYAAVNHNGSFCINYIQRVGWIAFSYATINGELHFLRNEIGLNRLKMFIEQPIDSINSFFSNYK